MGKNCEQFRSRLTSRQKLIGTFVKTPSPIVAEVLGHSKLDVFCVDVEHAPFGRLELDLCVAAFRAADRPSIVRVPDDSPTSIRNALDSGATGILVPHVSTAEQAARIVKAAHFGEGGRGFAGSTRAANFTTKRMPDHIGDSARETAVIVQIEDLAALANVSAIAAVDGVDAIFIGRADLAVAMSESPMDPEVVETVRRICSDAQNVDAAVGMFTPDFSEILDWIDRGCSFFLLSSDQSLMLAGANDLAKVVN